MIAQRVNREAVVVLGWGRAILMQLAHPLVAAGVAEHSRFDDGTRAYVARMRRTIGAMLSLTFGTEEQVRATAARINAVHRRVRGRLDRAAGRYPAGAPYDATDPALLEWVHATLVDSQLRTYALFVGPLTADERDRYCAEAARVGPRLGVPAGALPDTAARLRGYLKEMEQEEHLAVGAQARGLAAALLAPPGGRWASGPVAGPPDHVGPAAADAARAVRLRVGCAGRAPAARGGGGAARGPARPAAGVARVARRAGGGRSRRAGAPGGRELGATPEKDRNSCPLFDKMSGIDRNIEPRSGVCTWQERRAPGRSDVRRWRYPVRRPEGELSAC